jgi:hypothetical protein
MSSFVVNQKGDTIKGSTLKMKHGDVILDGKSYSRDNVSAYQNKLGFIYNDKLRVVNGKLDLYVSQADNSRMETRYVSSTQGYKTEMHGATTTTFYIVPPNGEMQAVTYNVMKKYFEDCPAALKKLESEFKGTYTKNHPDWATNHYKKLIPAVKTYNDANDCK